MTNRHFVVGTALASVAQVTREAHFVDLARRHTSWIMRPRARETTVASPVDQADTPGGMDVSALRKLLSDESAQGLTEYAIVVGTLVFAAIVTFIALSTQLKSYFTGVQGDLDQLPTS